MLQLTTSVKKILFLNILIFFLCKIFYSQIVDLLALHSIFSSQFRWYQLLTHLFMHISFWHMCSNTITLITFGPAVEDRLGEKRFLLFYVLVGIGASVFYLMVSYLLNYQEHNLFLNYLANPSADVFEQYLKKFPAFYENNYGFIYDYLQDPNNSDFIAKSKAIIRYLYGVHSCASCVGASGAVFGILMAFAMFYPHAQLTPVFFPIPIAAKHLVLFYGLYELITGMTSKNSFDNIAHMAHIGGILISYLLLKIYNIRRF